MPTIGPTPNAQVGALSIEATKVLRDLQYAIAQCRDAVFIADAAGTISRVNPAFEKLTGYSSFEAVGKDLSMLTAEGPYSEDYRQIWGKVLQQRAFCGSITFKHKSGERIPIEVTITPVPDALGQVGTLVCTCVQAATSTNHSLSNLATASPHQVKEVAHALNNTLVVVMAEAELSFGSLPLEHPTRVRLKSIQHACRRAADLVRLLYELEGKAQGAPRPEPLHYQSPNVHEEPAKPVHSIACKAQAKAAS